MTRDARSVVASLSIGLAVLLIVSPPVRRAAPAFAAPQHVAPLAVWGLVLLAISAALLLADSLAFHALMATACWYGFWAASLAYSTKIEATAPLTGWWVYGWISGVHLWLALRLRPHPRPRR